MAYVDFPADGNGIKQRREFWLSEDGLILIRGWRRQGVPVAKIATDYIGISGRAFQKWRNEFPRLQEAVLAAKEVSNMSVEEALWKRATGYDYWEETHELVEGQLILTKKVKKHMPPDIKAIMHYLYNRLPNRWRSIQEPLESTQYVDTVRNILVAMQEVAVKGTPQTVELVEDDNGEFGVVADDTVVADTVMDDSVMEGVPDA